MILICDMTGVPVDVAEERVADLLTKGFSKPEPKEKPAASKRTKAKPKAE